MSASRKGWRLWTEEEDEKLRALCTVDGVAPKRDAFWIAVSKQIPHRTAMGCQQRWLTLRGGKVRKPHKPGPPKTHHVLAPAMRPWMLAPVNLPQHATLTAMLLGDPLPGRSALDKRMGA